MAGVNLFGVQPKRGDFRSNLAQSIDFFRSGGLQSGAGSPAVPTEHVVVQPVAVDAAVTQAQAGQAGPPAKAGDRALGWLRGQMGAAAAGPAASPVVVAEVIPDVAHQTSVLPMVATDATQIASPMASELADQIIAAHNAANAVAAPGATVVSPQVIAGVVDAMPNPGVAPGVMAAADAVTPSVIGVTDDATRAVDLLTDSLVRNRDALARFVKVVHG